MMMWFGGWWMMVWMALFWIIVVGLALWLLSRLFPGARERSRQDQAQAGDAASSRPRQALDILNERYARGELTRAEYQEMRQDLEG